jgi:hypothetical protein
MMVVKARGLAPEIAHQSPYNNACLRDSLPAVQPISGIALALHRYDSYSGKHYSGNI